MAHRSGSRSFADCSGSDHNSSTQGKFRRCSTRFNPGAELWKLSLRRSLDHQVDTAHAFGERWTNDPPRPRSACASSTNEICGANALGATRESAGRSLPLWPRGRCEFLHDVNGPCQQKYEILGLCNSPGDVPKLCDPNSFTTCDESLLYGSCQKNENCSIYV